MTRRHGEGKVQQDEATGHDDPATICVTGAVAVVVFIEREEAWEAATASWSENKGDEGKGAWESRMCPPDQDSDQSGDGNSSDGEGSTHDGSSEEVIAMSQRTKHVHKKKRSKLKRNDSGSKTSPTSCCTVAVCNT